MYGNNKKRRKNETPPPSRRPQGPPNVPPSRPATPPVKAGNTRPGGTMKDIVNLSDILDEKTDFEEAKEIDKLDKIDKTERILENGLNADRKPLGKSMNRQLKKMQKMHKNKLFKGPKNIKSDLKLPGGEGSSPILSILRTSFANEETTRLQDAGEEIEVDVVSARTQEDSKKEEIPSKRGPTRPPLSAKKCRLLLQSYHNTKLRLNVWKDIRNMQGKFYYLFAECVRVEFHLTDMGNGDPKCCLAQNNSGYGGEGVGIFARRVVRDGDGSMFDRQYGDPSISKLFQLVVNIV